jgi:HlyD family secretion protein
MTATVSVVIEERKDALRLPAAALRFRPEGFEAGRGPEGGRARSAAGGGRPGGEGSSGVSPAAGSGPPAGSGAGPAEPVGRAAQGEGRSGGSFRSAVVFVPGPDGKPQSQRVRLGVSDGRFVEVVEGLTEGQTVITGAEEGGRSRTPGPAPSGANNPFQPQRITPRPRQ